MIRISALNLDCVDLVSARLGRIRLALIKILAGSCTVIVNAEVSGEVGLARSGWMLENLTITERRPRRYSF